MSRRHDLYHDDSPDPLSAVLVSLVPLVREKWVATYPEELAGQAVQSEARCALGKDGLIQSYVALQHERICQPFLRVRSSEMQGPRSVSGAVKILRSRVAQIDMVRVDDRAIPCLGLVVDHGSTGVVRSKQYRDELILRYELTWHLSTIS